MRMFKTILLILCISLCSMAHASAKEAKVKAAYLYNFTKFISGYKTQANQFNLCLFGTIPYSSVYDDLNGKNVQGKRIQIVKTDSTNSLSTCSMVYAPTASVSQATAISGLAISQRIIFVGDGQKALKQGSMVGLVKIGPNIKFELSRTTFNRANLKVSSKLYKLAVRVK